MSERAFASSPARQAVNTQSNQSHEQLPNLARSVDPILRRAIDRFWQTGEASPQVLVWLHRTLHSPERVRQTIQAARQNAAQHSSARAAVTPVKLATANHQASVTERAMEFIRRSGGSSLAPAVSTRAKQSLGATTENVKVHQGQEAAQLAAEAGAKAFSIGNHIVLGSEVANDDNFILAHETAHAVQQQSASSDVSEFSKSDSSYQAMEQNANLAAQAMMNGQSAQIAPASSLRLQCFDSYEHVQLGNQGGLGQTVRLRRDPSVVLTMGQVVALSGDFYSTPENLLNADPQEVRQLLALMARQERSAAQNGGRPSESESAAIEGELEAATRWRARPVMDAQGQRSTQGRRAGTDNKTYLDLAEENSNHFSPDNNHLWRRQHDLALTRAISAHQTTDSNERARLLNEARAIDGFGCHYLTDAFSSGHLVSGVAGRRTGRDYFNRHRLAITGVLVQATMRDPALGFPPLHTATLMVGGLQAFLNSRIPSLLLKIVHDHLNGQGMTVANARGDSWRAMGDRELANSARTRELAVEAMRRSTEELEHAALTGRRDSLNVTELIPSQVTFGNQHMTLEQFANSRQVYESILVPLIMIPSPANHLYQLVKGNFGIAGTVAADSIDVAAGHVETTVDQAIHGAQELGRDIERIPGQLEQNIQQLYIPSPYGPMPH